MKVDYFARVQSRERQRADDAIRPLTVAALKDAIFEAAIAGAMTLW